MMKILLIFCSFILINCEPIELDNIILREHVPIGYLVIKLNTTINETYSYRFVNTNQRDIQRYFLLNSSTGELSIKININRQLICPNRYIQCKIILKIFELYHEILYHIPIIIEDNEKFSKTIFLYKTSEILFHLSENSPIYQTKLFIQQQQIYNHDYKQWKYQLKNIEKNFPFIIEINNDLSSNRLALVLIQSLDREIIDQYNCTLYVTDTNGNNQQLQIKIIVDDINDHSPIFERDKYSIELSENTPINTVILRVQATDADIGLNGQIIYDFSDASKQYSSIFSINNETGVIQLRSLLDYEQRTSYIFYIEAHDLGQEIRSSQTLINITILNENDNYPEINFRFLPDMTYIPSKNLLQIPETYPIDKFFFQILITDQDNPINSQIHVWFKTNDTSFNFYQINNLTYFLNRTKPFDFESQQFYQLNFYAKDFHPKNSLQTKKILVIKILDENDNYPQFIHPFYHLSIQENNKINLILTQIQAYDLDQGENSRITYEILTNQTKFPFSIDTNTGILRCLRSFDREKHSDYHFEIVARDHGQPISLSSKVLVHINIEDINDNQPKFQYDKYEFSIEENFNILKSFGLIQAFDQDLNSKLIYHIDNNENFYINQKGEIFFRKLIDREIQDKYQFNVIVSDNLFQTNVSVLIKILDINDCKPIWKIPKENHTKLFINKDLITIGMKIFKFEVIDNDDISNGNGLISYFIKNTYEFLDLINQNELIFNSTPNLGFYLLEIQAKDHGKFIQYSSIIYIDLFIGDNKTNGSIYTSKFSHINSLSTIKRIVLLTTFFLSIAFILIFIISFILILICRSKKQKYLYYIKCNKNQNNHHPNMIIIDSNSNSSKLSLEDIQQTSLIDHSSSPSYTGTNIYTPHHQISSSTLKPTQTTSDYYSSSSKHEEDVDELTDDQQQRTTNDYNTEWSIEKILYPDWLYKDRTILTSTKHRFNTSTFNDFNSSQTFERNESIRSYSSNGKRIISSNNNQLSPKQVRFGCQEEIHLNSNIRQIRTGTIIQNNQSHQTFI